MKLRAGWGGVAPVVGLALGLAMAVGCAAGAAQAAPIRYTLTGTVSGTYDDGAEAFSGLAFSLVAVGDTDDMHDIFANLPVIPVASTTLTLGAASGDVTQATEVFSYAGYGLGGFTLSGDTDFFDFYGPGLLGWDAVSDLAPVDVYTTYFQPFPTTAFGTVSFSLGSDLKFSAVVDPASPAPEPAAWGLMLLGFGALGAVMRRRRPRALADA